MIVFSNSFLQFPHEANRMANRREVTTDTRTRASDELRINNCSASLRQNTGGRLLPNPFLGDLLSVPRAFDTGMQSSAFIEPVHYAMRKIMRLVFEHDAFIAHRDHAKRRRCRASRRCKVEDAFFGR